MKPLKICCETNIIVYKNKFTQKRNLMNNVSSKT